MKRLTLLDKAFILKSSPLFAQLDLDLLLPIADKLNLINCSSGDTIFSIKEDAHRMYFIVKGMVAMLDHHGNPLASIGPNEFFGDEALFSEQPRAYEAKCQSDTVLLGLSRTNLLTIISECPTVAVGLLNAYASTTPFRLRRLEFPLT